MEIQRTEEGSKGKFFIEKDGEQAAEMTHTMAGETRMIIDHTGVDDSLRGTGAGKQLVKAGVNLLGKRVLPFCHFALSQKQLLEKHLNFRMCCNKNFARESARIRKNDR